MAKKEEVVDLKPQKVTNEELTKIQEIVSNINRAQMEVGRYEAGKHTLLHTIQHLQGELKVVQEELEKEYGTVNVNIQDGTLNFQEDGEANKKD